MHCHGRRVHTYASSRGWQFWMAHEVMVRMLIIYSVSSSLLASLHSTSNAETYILFYRPVVWSVFCVLDVRLPPPWPQVRRTVGTSYMVHSYVFFWHMAKPTWPCMFRALPCTWMVHLAYGPFICKGKSPFFNFQLSCLSDFRHWTIKPNNPHHPTTQTRHLTPSSQNHPGFGTCHHPMWRLSLSQHQTWHEASDGA